ncbi:MAG: N-acetylmuramoyl-L-alanine amidase [Alphaproteobacteria bacterium]|nr:N-acetylmuramoyl-L-alanine amidase [Alphaproteobacteria bacterium]MDP3533236.1 N-acetylmuramoyl-L-alanine amidase [Alphaproteobacteria bacterium]
MSSIIKYPSPNFNERPKNAQISLIILHYTEMAPVQGAIDRLCDPEAKVSAHYLIEQNGQIYQLIEDKHRAWHAGISSWQGCEDVNNISIGIELDHPGHISSAPYPKILMASLLKLIKFLCVKHKINKKQIWGHSDIAPDRKIDPGEFFDWQFLAQHGFGMWFEEQDVNDLIMDKQQAIVWLQQIGYEVDESQSLENVIKAFQRHFYQENITGALDLKTYCRLGLLIQQNFR